MEEYKTWERYIAIHDDVVVKRQLRQDELTTNLEGRTLQPICAEERLRNEAATIQFVKSKTSIPVPSCRFFLKDGVAHLEVEKIRDGILLSEVEKELRPTAVAAVEKQMESSILPQLRSLRRNRVGSVDPRLPVFPPQRVYDRDRRPWPAITRETDCFVLCHADLGGQNIFIDPVTYDIVGIIDWEFSGFFPAEFELPLWRASDWNMEQEMYAEALLRELEFFGLKEEDLRDCLSPEDHEDGRVKECI